MINGFIFDERVNTSENWGSVLHNVFKNDGVLEGCEFSASGNTIRMAEGYFIVCGRGLENKGEEVIPAYPDPEITGPMYMRLKYVIDLTRPSSADEFTQGYWETEYSDADSFPDLVQEDINKAGKKYEMEAAVFYINNGAIAPENGIVRQMGRASIDADSVTGKVNAAENADKADKLTSSRKISLTGDVTGSGSFDGSANLSITTAIGSSKVTTDDIAASAVTADKIANSTITGSKIASSTITATQLASSSVAASELASNAVTTAKISNANVTNEKLANMAANRIKGRMSSSGMPEDLTAAQACAIVESGVEIVSNTNGMAWKYPSGRMVCRKVYPFNIPVSGFEQIAWVNVVYRTGLLDAGSWPVTFTAQPTITSISCYEVGTNIGVWSTIVGTYEPGRIGYYTIYTFTGGYGATGKVVLTAEGRWK